MLVSIIIPVFNVENEIDRCLKSVQNQTLKDIEIILVNDCSTDGSLIICESYQKNDKRFTIFNNNENMGPSYARNLGIKASKGKYILFVDSDDYIELDACENLVEIAEKNSSDIVVGSFCVHRQGDTIVYSHSNLEEDVSYSGVDYLKKSIKAGEFRCEQWCNLYLRDYWLKNELHFKEGIYHEDMEICIREFINATKISYTKNIFYHYMIRDNSITTSNNQKKRYQDIIFAYKELEYEISNIIEADLKKILYGFLVKCMVHSYADFGIVKPRLDILSRWQMIQYAYGFINKIKVFAYLFFPKLYITLYNINTREK